MIGAIGAIGALMNKVRQPRTLVVLGLDAEMGTAAGADELGPLQRIPTRTNANQILPVLQKNVFIITWF